MFEVDLFQADRRSARLTRQQFVGLVLMAVGFVFVAGGLLGFVWQANETSCFFKSNQSSLGNQDLIEASSSARIWVDVSGAVKQPGIYPLKAGDRFAQAVLAAGGFRKQVDKDYVSREFNLAQRLIDGQKVYVPFAGELEVVSEGSSQLVEEVVPASKISINQASQKQLEELIDVGPIRAQKIIQARPYLSLDELVAKDVLPKSVYLKNQPLLTL